MNATGMPQNATAARASGSCARRGRQDFETTTGLPVAPPENALPSRRKACKALNAPEPGKN